MRAKVSSLWERLDEPEEERELFLQQYQGYNLPTIQAVSHHKRFSDAHFPMSPSSLYPPLHLSFLQLEAEVERLNALKQENMSRFIQATRTELEKIWEKCYYGPAQRQEFILGFTGECTHQGFDW